MPSGRLLRRLPSLFVSAAKNQTASSSSASSSVVGAEVSRQTRPGAPGGGFGAHCARFALSTAHCSSAASYATAMTTIPLTWSTAAAPSGGLLAGRIGRMGLGGTPTAAAWALRTQVRRPRRCKLVESAHVQRSTPLHEDPAFKRWFQLGAFAQLAPLHPGPDTTRRGRGEPAHAAAAVSGDGFVRPLRLAHVNIRALRTDAARRALFATRARAATALPSVRRCKLDPGLKAPGSQKFNLKKVELAFNSNPYF